MSCAGSGGTELPGAGRQAGWRAPPSFIRQSEALVRGKLSRRRRPAEPPGTVSHSLGNPIPAAAAPAASLLRLLQRLRLLAWTLSSPAGF